MEPRERVIMKSIELFTLNGIRSVTMDHIALELGMSKRTIYELFKDKDTLVLESLETMHTLYMEELTGVLAGATNAIEALYMLSQHGEKKKASTNRLFLEDLRKIYPNIWKTLQQRIRPGQGSLSCTLLKQGIEEGIFREDINLDIVDTFIHNMMETFHNKELYPPNTTDLDLVRNIIIPYYKGISTERGQMLIDQYFPFKTL